MEIESIRKTKLDSVNHKPVAKKLTTKELKSFSSISTCKQEKLEPILELDNEEEYKIELLNTPVNSVLSCPIEETVVNKAKR